MPAEDTFWHRKRVLLTGHTGFKGSWLTIWLERAGAKITGISLPPATTPNLYTEARVDRLCDNHYCDIRDASALASLIKKVQPEIVFHLAAQPLVRASYREPRTTFDTNVMGTANLLDSLRDCGSTRVTVMITTDKVYRDTENGVPSREQDPLGGHDPYSASKAACEIVIASYRDAFLAENNLAVASARAGNVMGGGDWSEDRLIPDAVRAWQMSRELEVRRPDARRPWQHVLEPLFGYMTLARKLWHQPSLAGAYNFGPQPGDAVTVRALVEMARTSFGSGLVRYSTAEEGPHETTSISLEIAKARVALGVEPRLSLAQAIARTMAWYRSRQEGADALALCRAEIGSYEAAS